MFSNVEKYYFASVYSEEDMTRHYIRSNGAALGNVIELSTERTMLNSEPVGRSVEHCRTYLLSRNMLDLLCYMELKPGPPPNDRNQGLR